MSGATLSSTVSVWLACLCHKTRSQNEFLTEVNELKYDSASTKKTFTILTQDSKGQRYHFLLVLLGFPAG